MQRPCLVEQRASLDPQGSFPMISSPMAQGHGDTAWQPQAQDTATAADDETRRGTVKIFDDRAKVVLQPSTEPPETLRPANLAASFHYFFLTSIRLQPSLQPNLLEIRAPTPSWQARIFTSPRSMGSFRKSWNLTQRFNHRQKHAMVK